MKNARASGQPAVPAPAIPLLKRLGPGLITGAADDDPSGIATYSQAGTQFGYGLLWSVLFTTPLMIGIQIVSAHWTRHGARPGCQYPRPFPEAIASFHRFIAADREYH